MHEDKNFSFLYSTWAPEGMTWFWRLGCWIPRAPNRFAQWRWAPCHSCKSTWHQRWRQWSSEPYPSPQTYLCDMARDMAHKPHGNMGRGMRSNSVELKFICQPGILPMEFFRGLDLRHCGDTVKVYLLFYMAPMAQPGGFKGLDRGNFMTLRWGTSSWVSSGASLISLVRAKGSGRSGLILYIHKCIDDKFSTQVIKKSQRGCGFLDLKLTNKEELVGDVKVRDRPGCSCGMVWFRILRGGNKTNMVTTPCFRRADVGLLRTILLETTSWDTAPQERGIQEGLLIFKNYLFQVQKWYASVLEDKSSLQEFQASETGEDYRARKIPSLWGRIRLGNI